MAALKTELSEELVQEGLAREVVRRIQQLRKDADLDISDRIVVIYQASEKLAAAIIKFRQYITAETLANRIEAGDISSYQYQINDEFDGAELHIALFKSL